MHHEFSHILFFHNSFPTHEWEKVNPTGWTYIGSGWDLIGKRRTSARSPERLEKGFLEKYAEASLEEDFSVFAEWIFTRPDQLAEYASRYERIQRKADISAAFYRRIGIEL